MATLHRKAKEDPMTSTIASPLDPSAARTTGLLYLGVAITGMLGFLLIRPQLFDPNDAARTLDNLLARESLARAGVAFEMGLVVTQALTALWFFKLFRSADAFS